MTWPPLLPPATRSDQTRSASNHADDHNKAAQALADVVDVLGPAPAGPSATVTDRINSVESNAIGGREMAYMETSVGFSTTNQGAGSFHPTLLISVVGEGRAVDVVADVPGGFWHSVAGEEVRPYLWMTTVNGIIALGAYRSVWTDRAQPARISRRIALANGVTYGFLLGLLAVTPGTAYMGAPNSLQLASLSVTSR